MRTSAFLAVCFSLIAAGTVAQQLPDADVTGSSESDVVGRLPGSIIVSHFSSPLDQAEYPLSILKQRGGSVGNNVYVVSPDESLVVDGARTRNVYLLEPGVASFAAVRAYEVTLASQSFELVFSCRADSCGGTSNRAGSLGGNYMSLAYYLWPDDRILESRDTAGWCAQTGQIGNQEYRLLRNETNDTTVSILSYTMMPSQFSSCKQNFEGRVVVTVDVIGAEASPIELTIVTSDEMQDEISSTGKIALYGINFERGNDSLRDDSTDTINQIANLMNSDATLRLLIVGHTDFEGSFSFNQDLSERRAASVVRALVDQHGIEQSRLFPVGVSFASPIASNDTEQGRAQNRRVELVKF